MFKLNTWLTFKEDLRIIWLPIKKEGDIAHVLEYSRYSNLDYFTYRRMKYSAIAWPKFVKYKRNVYIDLKGRKDIIRKIFYGR